jgi:hypothetical protein
MITPRQMARLLSGRRTSARLRVEKLEDRNAPNSFYSVFTPVMIGMPGMDAATTSTIATTSFYAEAGVKSVTQASTSIDPFMGSPVLSPLPAPSGPTTVAPSSNGPLGFDPSNPYAPPSGPSHPYGDPFYSNDPFLSHPFGTPIQPTSPTGTGSGIGGEFGSGSSGSGGFGSTSPSGTSDPLSPNLPPQLPGTGTGGIGGGSGSGSDGGIGGIGGGSGTGSGMVSFTVGEDRGLSDSDGITNHARPVVTGTGMPGSTVNVLVNGISRGTGTVGTAGKFSVQLPQLPDGTHQISIAGATPVNWTIDTVAPGVKLEAPEFANTRTPEVTVNINHRGGPDSQSKVMIDIDLNRDGTFQAAERNLVVQTVSTSSVTLNLPELEQGTYRVRARVMDLAGNVGTSTISTIQVDPNAGVIGQQQLRRLITAYERFGEQTAEMFETTAFATYAGMGMPFAYGPVGRPEQILSIPLNNNIFDGEGRILVSVRATQSQHLDSMEAALIQDMNMDVVNKTNAKGQYMVTGWLELSQLKHLEELPHFNTATLVPRPITRVGAVTSQGDQAMRAAQFRAQTGFNGSGVGVGVLSDSADRFDGGLADSQATGDLPANVTILLDGPAGSSDEGRAMMEIVHDLAPGADLLFRTAVLGPQDFAQGIRDLEAAGARVITDDIGYASSPFFNDGVIAQAVDFVYNRGVLYTSAAGNSADEGFRAAWTSTTATVDGVNGTFFTFGGNDVIQDITIPAGGGLLRINVQWDDAYLEGGSALANFQVNTDIAVHLVDSTGAIVQTFDDDNTVTDEAFEFVVYNNTGNETSFGLAFQLVAGPAPTRIAWTNFGGDDVQAQGQGAPTAFGQVTARGAMATGAVDAITGEIQPYSSLGGNLEIFYDANGVRLSQPEIRRKPDVAGSDNVNTTFFGFDDPGDPDDFPNFRGTSAAAPHVAAAAALLFSQEPRATNDDVFIHLQLTALDLGEPGFDFVSGAGLVQLVPIRLAPPPNIDDDRNQTSDQASNLGVITSSQVINENIGLTPIGLPEYDWYKFTTLGGNIRVGSRLTNGQPLEMNIYREVAPGSLVQIGRQMVTSAGGNVTFPTIPGVFYYIEMKGQNIAPGVMTQGDYQLTIRRAV